MVIKRATHAREDNQRLQTGDSPQLTNAKMMQRANADDDLRARAMFVYKQDKSADLKHHKHHCPWQSSD